MDSLTLFQLLGGCLVASGLTVVAVYCLGVVGCPTEYGGRPPQDWSIRNRRAEMVGEWVDGVIATRTDQTESRSQPARTDRESRCRPRLAVRSHLGPGNCRRGRRPVVRLPHVLQLAGRRRGPAFHLR